MGADERVENLVLGGGEAGKWISWELGRQGKQVVVIERGLIGGSCPNIACLPSKNEIRSAKVASFAMHGAEFGVREQNVTVDMEGVRARKRRMVEGEVAFHLEMFKARHVQFLLGEGNLVGPRTVEVKLAQGGTRRFTGDRLFLNLGTRASVPDLPGLVAAQPLTHVGALELGRVPSHLIVIGAGYVGVELAQAFRRFGSKVTMLGRGAQVLANEDADVAAELRNIFESEGIDVQLNTEIVSVDGSSGERVRVRVQTQAGERTIEGSDVLVATGRTPNTRGIGLEEAGIALDATGYIKVDDKLQTAAANVWAMGECAAGTPKFTHAAFDDFRVVRDNLAGKPRSTRGRLVPYCVFTDPELAHVGHSEKTAQRDAIRVRVARLPMSSVLRAHTTGEMRGFMKMLVGTDDRILGFTMLGSEAGEVVAVVQAAMLAGMPYTGLRDAIFAHPTMAEGLGPLLANVPA
ncbi:MAG: FAD-dependent oxidoreductase [Kofleriaceae bacterium]|nr:FAD-dependent oxidoreductase [Kofleriaceae bacterium]